MDHRVCLGNHRISVKLGMMNQDVANQFFCMIYLAIKKSDGISINSTQPERFLFRVETMFNTNDSIPSSKTEISFPLANADI